MTKQDCEMALIRVMDAAQEIYKMYNPCASHLVLSFIKGTIMVTGYIGEDENGKSVYDIDACRFSDGTHRLGSVYTKPKEEIA